MSELVKELGKAPIYVPSGWQCMFCLEPYNCGSSKPTETDGLHYLPAQHPYTDRCAFSEMTVMIPLTVVLGSIIKRPPIECELCAAGLEEIDGWHYTRVGGMIFPTNKRCRKQQVTQEVKHE